jgi:glycerophosphoryl diester phosphodiesterase
MTLAELKALDAGSWFGEQFAGVRIPTLDEVFEAVGQRLYINAEIKSETPETNGVEEVVAEVIARYDMQRRVIVSSFDPLVLQRFRAVMSDVPIAFLYAPDVPVDTPAILAGSGLRCEARHPHESLIDIAYMDWARSEGYRVNAWTVNDPARARALRELGVDGIITDVPDVILSALRD